MLKKIENAVRQQLDLHKSSSFPFSTRSKHSDSGNKMKLLASTVKQSNYAEHISEKARQKAERQQHCESSTMSEFLSSKQSNGSVNLQLHWKGKLSANLMLFVILCNGAPWAGQTSCYLD